MTTDQKWKSIYRYIKTLESQWIAARSVLWRNTAHLISTERRRHAAFSLLLKNSSTVNKQAHGRENCEKCCNHCQTKWPRQKVLVGSRNPLPVGVGLYSKYYNRHGQQQHWKIKKRPLCWKEVTHQQKLLLKMKKCSCNQIPWQRAYNSARCKPSHTIKILGKSTLDLGFLIIQRWGFVPWKFAKDPNLTMKLFQRKGQSTYISSIFQIKLIKLTELGVPFAEKVAVLIPQDF